MDREPRNLLENIVNCAVIFALSAFLLKLGFQFLLDIWWVLLIAAALVAGILAWIRTKRNRSRW